MMSEPEPGATALGRRSGESLGRGSGQRGAASRRPLENPPVGSEKHHDASRGLRSGHSIPIGDRQSAHREPASFNEIVSERPTRSPIRPRSVTAFRIQLSSFLVREPNNILLVHGNLLVTA